LYNASIEGISERQGPHHVAQKLRNTTLPFRALNVLVSPEPDADVPARGRVKSLMEILSLRRGKPASAKTFAISFWKLASASQLASADLLSWALAGHEYKKINVIKITAEPMVLRVPVFIIPFRFFIKFLLTFIALHY
jgi:hypothetical protein